MPGFPGSIPRNGPHRLDDAEPVDHGERVVEAAARTLIDHVTAERRRKEILDHRPGRTRVVSRQREDQRLVLAVMEPAVATMREVAEVGRLNVAQRGLPDRRVEQHGQRLQQRIAGDDDGVFPPQRRETGDDRRPLGGIPHLREAGGERVEQSGGASRVARRPVAGEEQRDDRGQERMGREVAVLRFGDRQDVDGAASALDDPRRRSIGIARDEMDLPGLAVEGGLRGRRGVRIVASGAEQPEVGLGEVVMVGHHLHRRLHGCRTEAERVAAAGKIFGGDRRATRPDRECVATGAVRERDGERPGVVFREQVERGGEGVELRAEDGRRHSAAAGSS